MTSIPQRQSSTTSSSTRKSSSTTTSNIQVPSSSCPICLDAYPIDRIISLNCGHSFCAPCLTQYLKTRIKTQKVLKILCPQSGCEDTLPDPAIKKVLSLKQYNKYRKLVLLKVANRDLRNKFCPKPGCSRSISLVKKQEYTECSCKTKVCNTCGSFWHEGKSCIEALDQDFELYSKENNIRFCILCKTVVKREEGCLHITCPICDYEWCWTCGREYKSLHSCPGYWSPLPPSKLKTSNFTVAGFKNNWKTASANKKLCLIFAGIFTFPVILITFLLIWPLFAFFIPEVDITRRKPIKSTCLIVGSVIFGIFSLPVSIFYLAALLAGLALISPFLLIRFLFGLCNKNPPAQESEEKPKKRWMTGDVNNFTYVPASRQAGPTEVVVDNAAPPSQAAIGRQITDQQVIVVQNAERQVFRPHRLSSKEINEAFGSLAMSRRLPGTVNPRVLEITRKEVKPVEKEIKRGEGASRQGIDIKGNKKNDLEADFSESFSSGMMNGEVVANMELDISAIGKKEDTDRSISVI